MTIPRKRSFRRSSLFVSSVLVLCHSSLAVSAEAELDSIERFSSLEEGVRRQVTANVLAHRKTVAEQLIRVAADRDLAQDNRGAIVDAVELLGELRVAEAVPVLSEMLLFGREGTIHDMEEESRPAPPDITSPAVRALIKIGMPALPILTDKLLAIREGTPDKSTLALNCFWVIKGILGPRLGLAYIVQLREDNPSARNDALLQDGLRFMGLSIGGTGSDRRF